MSRSIPAEKNTSGPARDFLRVLPAVMRVKRTQSESGWNEISSFQTIELTGKKRRLFFFLGRLEANPGEPFKKVDPASPMHRW